MPKRSDILSWMHIGELHTTQAALENHRDLLRIVAGPATGIFDTQLGPNRHGREW